MRSDGHLSRNFLRGNEGGAMNVILAAATHNPRLLRALLAWLLALLLSFGAPGSTEPELGSSRRPPEVISTSEGVAHPAVGHAGG